MYKVGLFLSALPFCIWNESSLGQTPSHLNSHSMPRMLAAVPILLHTKFLHRCLLFKLSRLDSTNGLAECIEFMAEVSVAP